MKVFISSMISGYEPLRAAAKAAVTTLRHQALMAEDLGAKATSPQITCLDSVRSADLVVLILVDKYGTPQGTSRFSPTHEEFLEARATKPILVFVQQGVTREPQQVKFIEEVQAWQTGHFRSGFATVDELKEQIIQALHDHEMVNATGPLDRAALTEAATALLPTPRRNSFSGPAMLNVAITGGPVQRILRPAQLEEQGLVDKLDQRASFGPPRLFDRAKGVSSGMDGDHLVIEQDGGARIQLDERGALLLRLPLERTRQSGGFSAIIEERVVQELTGALAYASWLFDELDPTQRLSQIAVAISIDAGDYMGWRTQAEQNLSPNSGTLMLGRQEQPSVQADWPRAALRLEANRLAEDLMVRLRRHWKSR